MSGRRAAAATPDTIDLVVRVRPRASRTELVGARNGAIEIRLAAPPVDGAANEELVRFVAKELGVGRTAVEIVRGAHGREKHLRVRGAAHDRLAAWLGRTE